jgi:membrane-anchored protein YejM (alkaline phosphatase superfamily)
MRVRSGKIAAGTAKGAGSGSQRLTRTFTLYTLLSIISYAFIYSRYLDGVNTSGLAPGLTAYMHFSFWLHFAGMAAIGLIAASILESVLAQRRKFRLALFSLAGIFLTVYMYTDSLIYSAMSLHFNRFVLEALLQENALGEIGISSRMLLFGLLPVLFFVSVHILISPLTRVELVRLKTRRAAVLLAMVLLAALVGADKILYSYYYYKAKPFVFQLKDAIPAYLVPHPYHINKLFGAVAASGSKINFIEPMGEYTASSGPEHLAYPASPGAAYPEPVRRLNIILVAVESLRQLDMDSLSAPFFTSLAQESVRANNHYTGGNTTHFGLFSLFYGLNPFYFHDFRISQIPPAGIGLLEQAGYTIYSTTARTMQWYDLDKFLLGRNVREFMPETGRNYERDRLVTERSIEIAREHASSGVPYLNFVYYYTTHADYEHPDEHTVFEPVIKGPVDFSNEELRGADRHKLVNRYRNAIHSVDAELERLVRGIKEAGAWDNTILVITSDHGEEFFEENTIGHNTNLNEYQMRVPLLMHIPGKGHIDIVKNTSHMDIMQTTLGVIFGEGLDTIPFQGRNILSDQDGMVYVAKAHYQRPRGYAIIGDGMTAIANLQGGFLEIDPVLSDFDREGVNESDIRRGMLGLLRQIRELRR